jgi:thioredoxin 1
MVETKSAGMTVHSFNTEVSKDKLVLVDFYAKWCGPCKKMAPDLKALDEQYADKLTLVKIDADANGILVNELNVEALPTLQLYKDGVKVWSHTGYLEKKDIEKKIKEQL